jgi:hypothetical protein
MGTRERPESQTHRDKLENAERGQNTQQAGCDLDLAEHHEYLKTKNDGNYVRVNGISAPRLRSISRKIVLRPLFLGQLHHFNHFAQQCTAQITDSP